MSSFLPVDLIQPGVITAAGAALMWFGQKHRISAERRHAARLAELNAGAAERFFEERRSLEAYPPATRDALWKQSGAIVFGVGAYQFFLLLI